MCLYCSRGGRLPVTSTSGGSQSSSNAPQQLPPAAVQYEQSVDFELDVKVDIDSGVCVLHPKEAKDETNTNADNKAYVDNLPVFLYSLVSLKMSLYPGTLSLVPAP